MTKNVFGVALGLGWLGALAAGAGLSAQQGGAAAAAPAVPGWAYPVNPPGTPPAAPAKDDGTPRRVEGSNVALTLTQIRDFTNVPDWHPEGHPAMPEIVAHGRPPEVRFACAYCHYPNGRGRPENAGIAGLSAAYIVQQLADYKNGLRKSSEPRMGPPSLMQALAKNVTDAEVQAAAAYFSALKFVPWIKVVEAAMVPKSRLLGGMFVPLEEGGTEPLGQRILEMPQHLERTELRDSESPFIAYVPVGSLKKGEALASGGIAKTVRCEICHGPGLKGLGPVPGIAGRSPSYTMRALFDLKHGARAGTWSDLMKPVVAQLSEDDMTALSAYAASLVP
jgi:cytochrome c553